MAIMARNALMWFCRAVPLDKRNALHVRVSDDRDQSCFFGGIQRGLEVLRRHAAVFDVASLAARFCGRAAGSFAGAFDRPACQGPGCSALDRSALQ